MGQTLYLERKGKYQSVILIKKKKNEDILILADLD